MRNIIINNIFKNTKMKLSYQDVMKREKSGESELISLKKGDILGISEIKSLFSKLKGGHEPTYSHNGKPVFKHNDVKLSEIINDKDCVYDLIKNLFGESYEGDIVIAGGAVNTLCIKRKVLNVYQDIDVFIIGDNTLHVIKKLVSKIKKDYVNFCKDKMLTAEIDVQRNNNSLTIIMNVGDFLYNITNGKFLKIQFVLNKYDSVSDVLHSFDIDACCVGIHKEKLYFTERFLHSYCHNVIVINNELSSPSYIYRLLKYQTRGYNLWFSRKIKVNVKEAGNDTFDDELITYNMGLGNRAFKVFNRPLKVNKKLLKIYLKTIKGIKLLIALKLCNFDVKEAGGSEGYTADKQLYEYSFRKDETFCKIVTIRYSYKQPYAGRYNLARKNIDVMFNNVMFFKYIDYDEDNSILTKKITIANNRGVSFQHLDITEDQLYKGEY